MAIPTSPHDRTFKKIIKNLIVARDFFDQNLPADVKAVVNLDTLALTSENFIDDSFKESIADVIYTVKFGEHPGYLYCQIEHKAHQEDLCLWALRKKIDIMQRHCVIHNTKRYPLVYIIAVYHAKTPYAYPLDLCEATDSPHAITDDYLLKPLRLIDLNVISDEQLRQHKWAGILQYVQKHIRAKDFLPFLKQQITPWLRHLNEENEQLGRMLIDTLLYYIGEQTSIEGEVFEQVVHQELPEIAGEVMQTLSEKWQQQGLKRGLEQGLKQGTESALQQVAKRLLAHGLPVEDISYLTGLSSDTIGSFVEINEEVT